MILQLGNKNFPSFNQAKQYLKSLLKSNPRFLTTEEFNIVFDYLDYHPCAKEKKRHKIDKIKIDFPPNHKYKTHHCFVLYYENGEKEEFSYLKCNKNKTENIELNYKKAYRNAIKDQIIKFKNNSKELKCELCGKSNCKLEVDHKTIPFSKILKDFKERNKNIERPDIEYSENTLTRFKFKDKDNIFVRKWEKYHDIKADYQLLCPTCNQKKSDKYP